MFERVLNTSLETILCKKKLLCSILVVVNSEHLQKIASIFKKRKICSNRTKSLLIVNLSEKMRILRWNGVLLFDFTRLSTVSGKMPPGKKPPGKKPPRKLLPQKMTHQKYAPRKITPRTIALWKVVVLDFCCFRHCHTVAPFKTFYSN